MSTGLSMPSYVKSSLVTTTAELAVSGVDPLAPQKTSMKGKGKTTMYRAWLKQRPCKKSIGTCRLLEFSSVLEGEVAMAFRFMSEPQ